MKRSKFRTHLSALLFSLLALSIFTSTMHATALSYNTSNLALTCNVLTGPVSRTVVVSAASTLVSPATIIVALGTPPAGVTVTAPSATTLSASVTSLTYTFSAASGCIGFSTGTSTYNFKIGTTPDAALTIATTLTSSLVLNPTSISLNCNTITGPGTVQTVNVKPATAISGAATLAVTLNAAPTGLAAIGAPTVQTFSLANGNSSAGINYTFNAAAACASFTTSTSPVTFQFKAAGVNDASLAVNTTLGSNLSVSPNPIVMTCVYNGTTSTPQAAQTINVTASATTAYTVDNTSANRPATWASLGGTLTSASTPGSFTVAPVCGTLALGSSNSTSIHLVHSGSTMTDRVVPVTLKIVSPSTLHVSTATPSLTYVKGSGSPGIQDVIVSATSGLFFSVDTTSLPIWLTVDTLSGNVSAGVNKSIRFSSTSVVDTMAPGSYSQPVHLKVSGQADTVLTVTLQVNSAPAKLSVSDGYTRSSSWTVGDNVPSFYVTLQSSGSAIPYSIAVGGALKPIVNQKLISGLAYSFGTPIPVSFSPDAFAAAQAGTTLSGTVSITWGNPSSTTVVTFNIAVQSPGATLSSITPAALPTASQGIAKTLYLYGTGFIVSTDPNVMTNVKIWNSNTSTASPSSAFAVIVTNPSNLQLTITVPAASDTTLPFASGGTVTLAVCNPVTSLAGVTSCTPGTNATQQFSIGSTPTIQTVTSASSFAQVGTQTQVVAPYDMLSIFGFNFCSTCSSNSVMYGTPDATTLRYPTNLYPDPLNTAVSLRVGFYTHGGSLLAWAPLLFATNSQINVVVPGSVPTTGQVDIQVSFNGSTSAFNSVSLLNGQTTNPGIFTVGSDGQGDGAILDQNYAVVGLGNPAAARSGVDSDTISIYMTGLGTPDSDEATGPTTWDKDCIAIGTYSTLLGTSTSTSTSAMIDGDVILRSLIPSTKLYAPCIKSGSTIVPTVTIGGIVAPVAYAGWVADSIAGLFQVNVQLPPTTPSSGHFTKADGSTLAQIVAPVQLPVKVTADGHSSQDGVTLWIAPRLMVAVPANTVLGVLPAKVGLALGSGNTVQVSDSTNSPFAYMITGGLLPSGLSLAPDTGIISGTPAMYTTGDYPIAVTVTDSAAAPLTGSVSFTVHVGAGLVTTASPSGNVILTNGTAQTVAVLTPTGGSGNYFYTITPTTPITGLSITPAGATSGPTGTVAILSSTAATSGAVSVTVTATDAVTSTLTGSYTFTLTVN